MCAARTGNGASQLTSPHGTGPALSTISLTLARLLVFGSSAAILVIEVIAVRLVAPYIGVTHETFTGIIGIVLTGIAIGAWLGGRIADRLSSRPLLGPLLIVAGLLIIAVPSIVSVLGPRMRAAGPLEIVTLTTAAFFLPALVLSSVPPIVVKLRLRALDETGRVVGSLSALSTAGAIAGTFVTGFVLVAALPTRPLVLGMGAVLVVVGTLLARVMVSRRSAGVAILGTLVVTVGLGMAEGPCDYETTYFCAVVEVDADRPTGRTLWLDARPHSYVDLADPTYLNFRYAKTVAAVVAELPPGPISAAYIGGGGFTLPRYVAAVRPGSTAVVFEIDGALVNLVQRDLGLELDEALRVEVGDARLRLPGHSKGTLDFVMGDAFGGLSVPWHLTTREFLIEIDRVLADDGVYAVNVIDYPPNAFARAEVATFLDVFEHVAVIAPVSYLLGGRGGNFVVVGSRSPLPAEAIQRRLDTRRDFELIWTGSRVAEFVEGARVLTDDFAPVDQLLSGPQSDLQWMSPPRP